MPLINRDDRHGRYFKWGERGHKYYYVPGDRISRNQAKRFAMKQMYAIQFSQGRHLIKFN
jgi:hypothetical protein